MQERKYILRYLPLFYGDVEEKVSYIAFDLGNPQAASELLDLIEQAVLERLPFAESFGKYFTYKNKKRSYPYYRIFVKNFVIYYVVIYDRESGNKTEDFFTRLKILTDCYKINLPRVVNFSRQASQFFAS